ncbi:hypothetical protein [Pseudonocardia acaciae]|uniref:hypothetical protein n=1 Tax=Pseudonocardia acaciae TaxID=551276 RepID=UPI00048F1CDC|nr:hypothetical protein [Pseudonocardia acaciae]
MAPRVHHRANCRLCDGQLVFLVGDPSVPYEEIEPSDGGPDTLVEHTEQRCEFHRFLTPAPGRHVLPGDANWIDRSHVAGSSGPRWTRTDLNR